MWPGQMVAFWEPNKAFLCLPSLHNTVAKVGQSLHDFRIGKCGRDKLAPRAANEAFFLSLSIDSIVVEIVQCPTPLQDR